MTLSFDTSLMHLLHKCSQTANAMFRSVNTVESLTQRQYILMASIYENQGLSQTDIVERSGIDRSTTTALVRRLLSAKLIVRRRAPHDTRAYVVRLTPLGEKALFDLHAVVKSVDTHLLSDLTPGAREALLSALSHIAVAAPPERAN